MLGNAFVIAVIGTVYCLAVDADGFARVLQRAGKPVSSHLRKALAAGIVLTARALSANHNVSLATALTFVIYAIFHTAF